MNSKVFSARELFHVGKLTKEGFVQKWGKRQTAHEQYGRKIFSSRYHRLPKSFSNIMKKKSWTSVNEEQYGKSYSAWERVRFYTEHTLAETNVKVDDTWILIQPLLFAGIVYPEFSNRLTFFLLNQFGLHLQNGLNSVMCFPGQLLSQLSTETTVLSLGNRLWATMVWPLEEHGHHDRFQTYKLSNKSIHWGVICLPIQPR